MDLPAQIGRYLVDRPLGEGGMASAVLAHHASTGDRVVLKIPLSAADDVKERVRDEARTGIRLSHPHIVETLDLVEYDGRPVLVVRYIEGCALSAWWKLGPAPVVAVAHVGTQIADALSAIHEATDESGTPLGTLHRDVAPGNVLVSKEGDAMLIDLGIARSIESKSKRTEVGIIKGTLRYLAPEILDGKPQSVETDLWALGVCLFEAAVGRRAVSGDDRAILRAVVQGRLLDLRPGEHVDPELLSVIATLAGRAGARFSNARAAAIALATLRDRHGGEEAGAAFAAAWVARSPQSDNVGNRPGDDEPRTMVDGAIGSGKMHKAPGPAPAPHGAAETMRVRAVDDEVLKRAARDSPSARAITFADMPASDPGLDDATAPVAHTTQPPAPAPTVVIPAARWEQPKPTALLPTALPAVGGPAPPAQSGHGRSRWSPVLIGAALAIVVAIVVVALMS